MLILYFEWLKKEENLHNSKLLLNTLLYNLFAEVITKTSIINITSKNV